MSDGEIKTKPLCIIPARGGSKRFPRKNLAPFLGKPLLAHAIESAQESSVFDVVCVSSEDHEILEVARSFGADMVIERPQALATDAVQIREVCGELLRDLSRGGRSYKDFGVLLTTNPLRTPENIREAYALFCQTQADFVMTVVSYTHPPQRALRTVDDRLEPFIGVDYMKQTQRLEPLYRHDGTVIFGQVETFLETGEFYSGRIVPFIMQPERSVDIDTPLDLEWAEFLARRATDLEATKG